MKTRFKLIHLILSRVKITRGGKGAARWVSVPLVGLRAVGAVLLNMHTKEADVHTVDVLKGKKSFGPVRERLGHLSTVHKPESRNIRKL